MQGLQVTLDEVEHIREQWFTAFPEMRLHMQPTRMTPGEIAKYSRRAVRPDEDDEDDDGDSRKIYVATNLTGRKRNRCTFTSALNYVFQSLCSDGAKVALWKLYLVGLGPFIWDFIHDEVDYMLPENRVRDIVPIVEREMVSGMHTVIPDVRIAVETTINRHWDKEGVNFSEAEYDDQGRIIVPEVEFVASIPR